MDVVRHHANHGWIEVIVGSMFSGKSEELIRRLRRAQIAKQKVQIFKPAIDTRFADDHIVSHSEMRIPSEAVASSRTLLDAVEDAFGLAQNDLAAARGVLQDHGNMSSGTVMFVLERLMRQAAAGAPGCAMAFGPGLVAETMQFRMAS